MKLQVDTTGVYEVREFTVDPVDEKYFYDYMDFIEPLETMAAEVTDERLLRLIQITHNVITQ